MRHSVAGVWGGISPIPAGRTLQGAKGNSQEEPEESRELLTDEGGVLLSAEIPLPVWSNLCIENGTGLAVGSFSRTKMNSGKIMQKRGVARSWQKR
ncbi:MAG: hypothetical protein C4576_01345 [Desulfobacteraceae bacterium]|nr:MAG: hypothetical protein C4576_01345 [Desulfobacteraceae bacterium]